MNCPRCKLGLQHTLAGDVYVDVCNEGCMGIWFDRFELAKLDEPHESVGESLLRNQPILVEIELTPRLNCPKCHKPVMMRHFWSVKRRVEVDQCPGCAGFWLDYGELGQIRSLFETEAERRRAADEYFDEIFGEKLAMMRAESEAKLEAARRIYNMLRFICPSNYFPERWSSFTKNGNNRRPKRKEDR